MVIRTKTLITAAEQKIKFSFSCILLQCSETSISVHHQKNIRPRTKLKIIFVLLRYC
jgi:hypothetical protein